MLPDGRLPSIFLPAHEEERKKKGDEAASPGGRMAPAKLFEAMLVKLHRGEATLGEAGLSRPGEAVACLQAS